MEALVETTNTLTRILKTGFQVLANCPTTHQLVVRNEKAPLAIPGGQATWWYCSVCQGWHVFIEDDVSR